MMYCDSPEGDTAAALCRLCTSCFVRKFLLVDSCMQSVIDCVQSVQLESDDEAAEKRRRRRRKDEDETETSDDDDESDDGDDDEADKQVRKRGRTRKNLVHGFTCPEIRKLIKSIKKFARPTNRSVTMREVCLTCCGVCLTCL